MLQKLEIHHSTTRAAERVARWHNVVRSRLAMLVLLIILSGSIYFWQRQKINGLGIIMLFLVCAVALVWFVIAIVWNSIAKRDLATVGEGVALTLDPVGVKVSDWVKPWHEIAHLKTRSRGLGRSPELLITAVDGQYRTLYLQHLDVMPSQIDDAVRAWTNGRIHLELGPSNAA